MHTNGASSDPTVEKLQLADWRRRITELYAEVRGLAATDPGAAWNRWRLTREKLYREHPSSPVLPDARGAFVARHFAYDPRLRFEAVVHPAEAPAPAAGPALGASLALGAGLALPISVGRPISFDRVGWLELPFESGVRRLALFWLPEYASGFFLPFRDATNGAETYGGGRYLIDSSKGADLGGDPTKGTVIVDFNFAYQPSCAFDPRWSCPLSPPENRLDLEIRAGEAIR
ncbi:MAG: DUF1684 domain-containing protein [Candidatus Limnocylindrales bacterium]